VEDVMPDSPADRAGIQRGSVVLSYDGMSIGTSDELIMAVGRTPVGKLVKLQIRDPKGSAAERSVRVGLRSSELVRLSRYEGDTEEPPGTTELLWRGMRVKELAAEEAAKTNGKLRITRIKKGSPADRAGLYEGAYVDEIKTTEDPTVLPVQSIAQLRQALTASKGQVYIRVPVGGYILVEPEEKP
jgi:serine protease Do